MYLGESSKKSPEARPTSGEMFHSNGMNAIIETPFDDFHIKLADSDQQRTAANLLVEKMYLSRGYKVEHAKNNEQNRKTLVVEAAGEVIGTMSICMDNGFGLPADENYGDKLNLLRDRGRKVCEPSRLAIGRTLPHRVFATMIHLSYVYSHKIHGCTDYVIEVNPRHANFYKKVLGFHEFGELRTCTRVNAPAVLLRLECIFIDQRVKEPTIMS
jgi:hypothetical protein